METAVTVTTCVQIGIETWRDINRTKVFNETSTLGEIDAWIKSIDKTMSTSSVTISQVESQNQTT